jgi:hypothetical protein
MDNTLQRLKAESFALRDDAARKLTDELAALSLRFAYKGSMEDHDFSGDSYLVDFWKKRDGKWQIIARCGCAVGKPPERPALQLQRVRSLAAVVG